MKPLSAPGTRECEHEGCHARVMVASGHVLCGRHRAPPKATRPPRTPRQKARRNELKRERRKQSNGILGGFESW